MATTFDWDTLVMQVFSAKLNGGEVAKFKTSMALTAKHISFHNMSEGTAFTVAATVENAGSEIDSSSDTLAADTTEEFEDATLSNRTIADGAIVTLQAGDLPTYIVLTCWVTYVS